MKTTKRIRVPEETVAEGVSRRGVLTGVMAGLGQGTLGERFRQRRGAEPGRGGKQIASIHGRPSAELGSTEIIPPGDTPCNLQQLRRS